MNAQPFTADPAIPDPSPISPALQVLVVYRDIAAGQRAVGTIADLTHGRSDEPSDLSLRVQFWRFDLLLDSELRMIATGDMAASDVIVVADSSDQDLDPAVKQWLTQGFCDRQGIETAVVAFFGRPADPDGPDSARLQFVQTAARDAGLNFFAPMPQTADSTILRIEGIRRRAEALTPTLEHILRQPARPLAADAGY